MMVRPTTSYCRRLRFSLRTLLLAVFLAASGLGLWWRWEAWRLLLVLNFPHEVYSFGFSPDGRYLFVDLIIKWEDVEKRDFLTIERNRELQIVDSWTGKRLSTLTFTPAQFLFEGQRAGSAIENHAIREGVDRNKEMLPKYASFLSTCSPDGQFLLTTDADGNLKTLNAKRGFTGVVLEESTDSMSRLAFSSDGKRIFAISFGRSDGERVARVWDAESGRLLTVTRGRIVNYTSDLRRLLIKEHDYTVRDTESGKCLCAIRTASSEAAFVCDGRYVVTRDNDGVIWDAQTGRPLYRAKGKVFFIFFPGGNRALVLDDEPLRLIDVRGGRVLSTVNTVAISHAFLSPCGRFFATTSREEDGLRLWDTHNNTLRLVRILQGFYFSAFSADGKRFAANIVAHNTGGDGQTTEGTVMIWNSQTGQELARFRGFSKQFSPVDNRFAVEDHNHIRIWERRRPEYGWGILGLWETWAVTVFGGMLVWSLIRDGRRFGSHEDTLGPNHSEQ